MAHPTRRSWAVPVATALLVLGITASGALAGGPAIIVLEIDLDTSPSTETFTADHPLLCPSGDATTNFERGAGIGNGATSFHLTKLLVCDDGSGSFVIRVDAATNFIVGTGTTGGWSVVPGSGTGDYVGLKGGGNLVGVNSDTPPVDLTDLYFGSLRL